MAWLAEPADAQGQGGVVGALVDKASVVTMAAVREVAIVRRPASVLASI